jgi:hypothetical protein
MTRILVVGGGFAGLAATRRLERLLGERAEITLVSRDNFFVLTPLLFEACSGRLELRHCAQPIRPALRRARFVEATMEDVDVDRQLVRAKGSSGVDYELAYDQLVVALGAATNTMLIPGSETAFTFKGMGDALALRNHVIERFEAADAALNPASRARCLCFVVIGGGRCAPRRPCARSTERACTSMARRSRRTPSCLPPGSSPAPPRVAFPSLTTVADGSRWTRRCGARAIPTSGRWAIARRFQDRTGAHTLRWRNMRSARRERFPATWWP